MYVQNVHLGELLLRAIPMAETVDPDVKQRVLVAVQSVAAAHNRKTGFVFQSKSAVAAARAAALAATDADPTLDAELSSALAGTLEVGDLQAWERAMWTAAQRSGVESDFFEKRGIDYAGIKALDLQGFVVV